MSSPLDSRIRNIARQEATALLGVPGGVPEVDASAPTVEQMQQQITDLHEHLHQAATTISRLEARLEVLEKGATAPAPVKRTARKATADPSEETAESSK